MAAIVYNGVIRGTGNHVVQTLYTNSTGGNVRILWNWLKSGGTGSDQDRKIFYGPTPTFNTTRLAQGDLNHTSGDNLSVIEVLVGNDTVVGKDMAYSVHDDTVYVKMTNHWGEFPLEIMLANTHKISLWTESGIGSGNIAIAYNFVVIPE